MCMGHLLNSGSKCTQRRGKASPDGAHRPAQNMGLELRSRSQSQHSLALGLFFLFVLLIFTNLVGQNAVFFVSMCVSLVITEAELFPYLHWPPVSLLYEFPVHILCSLVVTGSKLAVRTAAFKSRIKRKFKNLPQCTHNSHCSHCPVARISPRMIRWVVICSLTIFSKHFRLAQIPRNRTAAFFLSANNLWLSSTTALCWRPGPAESAAQSGPQERSLSLLIPRPAGPPELLTVLLGC